MGAVVDALNAEISLGTVATVDDGVQWIGYTYLFVRMKKNPYVYGKHRTGVLSFSAQPQAETLSLKGLTYNELSLDPTLCSRREDLIKAASEKLAEAQMIAFNKAAGALSITDLGRIAAKYYIRHSSIEIFNAHLRPEMTEADVLGVLSMSSEVCQRCTCIN
jgi:antiviral helicase SLH1